MCKSDRLRRKTTAEVTPRVCQTLDTAITAQEIKSSAISVGRRCRTRESQYPETPKVRKGSQQIEARLNNSAWKNKHVSTETKSIIRKTVMTPLMPYTEERIPDASKTRRLL